MVALTFDSNLTDYMIRGLGSLPTEQMATDVGHSFDILSRFTAHPTRYFRFPGDCYDSTALAAIAPVGCTVIHYDVASGDAFGTNADAIVRHVLSTVHNGSIVVMHVTGGNTAPLTATALPSIIAGLRAKGYQLVRVSTLLGQESGS
jgi:peptidoglycan/xylan/chitin deacetylase (PgdA/CDA1 family)